MKTETFLKSNAFKILLPFAIVLSIIYLLKMGYQFGQWLHLTIN